MMRNEGEHIVVRSSIPRVVLAFLGSTIMAVASFGIFVGWLYPLPERLSDSPLAIDILILLVSLPTIILALTGSVFFGYGTIYFASRLIFFKRPIVELHPGGITDHSNIFSPGFVEWEKVRDAFPVGNKIIGLSVKDERMLTEHQPLFKRLGMRLNSRYFTSCPINIPMNALPLSEIEMLQIIKPHLETPAQKRLEKRLSSLQTDDAATGVPDGTARSSKVSRASHFALLALKWSWTFILTILFVVTGSMIGFFGAIVGWSGLRVLFDLGTGEGEWWHAPVGLAMIGLGVLMIFKWMDPAIRRLSGRKPIDFP